MGIFKKKKTDDPFNGYFDRDLMKKVLDYNQDNLVDVNDIISLSKDIGNSFDKYSSLLKKQSDQVKNDSSKL